MTLNSKLYAVNCVNIFCYQCVDRNENYLFYLKLWVECSFTKPWKHENCKDGKIRFMSMTW